MSSAAGITSPGVAAAAPPAVVHVDPARVVAFLAMCFGMFMAFLDIQVVSASLAQIQAGLAASSDEITWVQTAYLMAEVVAIPLSGFLSRALGTRIMFATAAADETLQRAPDDHLIHRRRQPAHQARDREPGGGGGEHDAGA